ncbi:NlpC/P60 family protein [Algimonas porphyrae]|uniref:C40 family peptidase n=1 Tax=Algimonas porphyrae TaxID=1128113 RepID=UPI00352A9CA6
MARDPRVSLPRGSAAKIARHRVAFAYAPILSEPDHRARQLSELVHGQDFDIHAEQGGWVLGRARSLIPGQRRHGYVGWVDSQALVEASSRRTHRVSTLSAPLFSRPDLKSHIVMSLPMGSCVTVTAQRDGYLQLGSGAYLSLHHVRPLNDPETGWVTVARRYLGQPYVWGGNGARGVDCSGLVQMSFAVCGIDAPRDADMQERALGHVVDAPEQAGDLLFWPGHVGILTTKTRLLHANAHHMGVVEEPLGPALKRMARADVHLRTVKRL